MTRERVDPNDGLNELFGSVERSAWRWECQGHYAVDKEGLDRWLRGEPDVEDDDDRAWVAYIERLTAAGVPFQRVRMLGDPLTDHNRWMLAITGRNTAAGEDVRWIGAKAARELDMPTYDFYLVDDRRVAILRFDTDKELTGVEVIDDEDVVHQHRQLRDRVWPLAVPHAEYVR